MPNVNGKMFPYTAEGKAAAAAEKANMPSYKMGGMVTAKRKLPSYKKGGVVTATKYSNGHKQKSMVRT
jgi:hypothetical protein